MIIIVMGVSGCGKTTAGVTVANRLGCRFVDADDFHPDVNIDKMTLGIPLEDTDRIPWLETLREILTEADANSESLVLACSALKQSYRDILNASGVTPRWVYLKGSYEEISGRLKKRTGHFMKEEMLRSQFDVLEEPDDALVINALLPPEAQADMICRSLA